MAEEKNGKARLFQEDTNNKTLRQGSLGLKNMQE